VVLRSNVWAAAIPMSLFVVGIRWLVPCPHSIWATSSMDRMNLHYSLNSVAHALPFLLTGATALSSMVGSARCGLERPERRGSRSSSCRGLFTLNADPTDKDSRPATL